MEISYTKKALSAYFHNKSIVGLVGELADASSLVDHIQLLALNENKTVKSVIGKESELIKTLHLEAILKHKLRDLSKSDYKLVSLIKTIILKPELIILNNFEIGFNPSILNKVIRFIKNIQIDFNIKFIIISKDPLFLNKISQDVIVMKNKIIKYQGAIMLAIKQNILVKPKIIDFIELANRKGAALEYTLDEKELLKSIYRSVN